MIEDNEERKLIARPQIKLEKAMANDDFPKNKLDIYNYFIKLLKNNSRV